MIMQQCKALPLLRKLVSLKPASIFHPREMKIRQFRTGMIHRAEKPGSAEATPKQSSKPANEGSFEVPNLTSHKVNKYEKFLLVWGGKYKTMDEVPALVRQDVLEKARNKARIKINITMMILTAFGCIYMIYLGKQAHSKGESVQKRNLEWHRQINEEAKKEKEKGK